MVSVSVSVFAPIALAVLALVGCTAASGESSVWNDDGDLVLSPAAEKSVISHSDIFVNGERVSTENEALALIAALSARVSAVESQLLGPCASQPCQNGATCSYSGANAYVCACAADFTGVHCERDAAFISEWYVVSSITLPLLDTGTYACVVDWGDGSAPTPIDSHDSPNKTHVYPLAGTYTITIRGTLVGWRFGNTGDVLRIRAIKQWGSARLGNHPDGGYFYGCSDLAITATDPLDLTDTFVLAKMFRGSAIDHRGNLSEWDTKSVTDMSDMFEGASQFNQPLSFDTSSVTNMFGMFNLASSFNQPISFNTKNVNNMGSMFRSATQFNQQIDFNTTSVTNINGMFFQATSFNQPLNFDTSKITDSANMVSVFAHASSFNQDLSHWCVSSIATQPTDFDLSASLWSLDRPIWGSCPS